MGRKGLLFGLGAGAAASVACTAILGDFTPTTATMGNPDGGDAGSIDAATDSAEAGKLPGFLATSVAAGEHHTCAIRDGRVFCWGRDLKGQLGQNPQLYPNGADHPIKISALGEAGKTKAIVAVAAGYNHTCALDGEGSVFCWGQNDRGQLGNSTLDGNPHPDPGQVLGSAGTGVLQNVIAISAGEAHTCAATPATVYCWGDNTFAQSGVNPVLQGQFTVPHDVGGDFPVAKSVSAGPQHTCASSGTVFTCWGTQVAGELGLQSDGGPSFVTVSGTTATNSVGGLPLGAIAAGEQHSCVQTTGGTGAACWGDNAFGQVGALDAGPYFDPTNVAGLPAAGVTSVVTGASYSCALVADKTVVCWGKNDLGQLGQGTVLPGAMMNAAPKPVATLAGVTSLSAGFDHACAVVAGSTTPGQVFCWGAGANNQLGIGANLENQSTPKLVNAD